jgi:hypothetical protein
VRAVPVVMAAVIAQNRAQVPFAVDEHPAGALASCGSYPSPGLTVRPRPLRTHRPQAGTAIRWPRATPPRIPSRGRRNTGVPGPEDVPPAVAMTGTTPACCPGPTARCVRRRAAREAPFRNERRSANAGDAEVDA